jgi:hypothetical protein
MQKKNEPDSSPVQEIVDDLIAGMSLRERSVFADLTEEQLLPLQLTLTKYIAEKLITTTVKEEVLEDCMKIAEDEDLTEYEAAAVILWVMWKRLRETNKLRVVK